MPGDVRTGLLDALALKHVDRAGWLRHGIEQPESVAAHSWGVAWLVLVLAPPDLDRGLALSYAVLHDLAEVKTGDLTPHDGVSAAEKSAREATAIGQLSQNLPSHVAPLWHAYEAQADPESRFVRQLDRLDMALQAAAYAQRDGVELGEFLVSAARDITDPTLRALLVRLSASAP